MSIPHPIPYQGSKRQLASLILGYFPADVGRLIEPFAGSGAVSIAAAHHKKARAFVLNDLNEPLIALWDAIINQPDQLANRYEFLWSIQQGNERKFYDLVRARFNKSYRPYYFLYLLARCVKASVRYNADGEFNQSPDNRRKGRQPNAMRRDILATSALLRYRTLLMSGDYCQVLAQAALRDIVYMDPPYQGVSQKRDPRYVNGGVSFERFVASLNDLNERQISYIVSYDGRTGQKAFGSLLPDSLDLHRIEIHAGRSSQATLLGRSDDTYESLYLSPALVKRLDMCVPENLTARPQQLTLFGELL